MQVMIIITGKGEKYGLNREDFLPVTTMDRNTRMNTKTLLEKSLERSDHHQKGLSTIDIQRNLVKEYLKGLDLTLAQTTLALGHLGPSIRANFSLWTISFWPKSHFGQSNFGPRHFGP